MPAVAVAATVVAVTAAVVVAATAATVAVVAAELFAVVSVWKNKLFYIQKIIVG